jgi:hypothetical protein
MAAVGGLGMRHRMQHHLANLGDVVQQGEWG